MSQHASEVEDATVLEVLRAYARQSRLIDGGDATGWADTFTVDGEFCSPSYPAPVQGRDDLVAFAERFSEADRERGTRTRHVVSTVDVLPGPDRDHVVSHAYLQIVTTPTGEPSRLVRLTTLEDHLVRHGARWLFARRVVTRDD